jgi:hypothetical protein
MRDVSAQTLIDFEFRGPPGLMKRTLPLRRNANSVKLSAALLESSPLTLSDDDIPRSPSHPPQVPRNAKSSRHALQM